MARADAEKRIHLTLIEEWVKRTDTGDRAEIDELPDDLSFWGEIAATTENCLGSACPQFGDCFVTRMRERAAESDVVIVNHHLLCADAAVRHHSFGEVIPECHVLVVDEAHQLEEIATQYFGITISNFKIEELVADALRVVRVESGPLREIHRTWFVRAADGGESAGRRRRISVAGGIWIRRRRQLREIRQVEREERTRSSASSVNARAGFGGHEQIDMLRPAPDARSCANWCRSSIASTRRADRSSAICSGTARRRRPRRRPVRGDRHPSRALRAK